MTDKKGPGSHFQHGSISFFLQAELRAFSVELCFLHSCGDGHQVVTPRYAVGACGFLRVLIRNQVSRENLQGLRQKRRAR